MVKCAQGPKCMYPTTLTLLLVGFFIWSNSALAAMSSTNYRIDWDTVGAGGSDSSSSATYQLRDTIGNTSIGGSSSATYDLNAGYRGGVFDRVVAFDLYAQTGSNTTAISLSSTTITVGSTSTFSVGDFVALIQDKGASQVSAVGEIVSIGASSLTVDELKNAGVAPTIDGTNDFVYKLSGTIINFGSINSLTVGSGIIAMNATVDNDAGYSIQVYDDGNLRSGGNDINDVSDGTVSVGAEEYGARSSDTSVAGSTFDSQETAFTTSMQTVVDESQGGFERRNFLTLKVSVTPSTPQIGTYSHSISFILSGNF